MDPHFWMERWKKKEIGFHKTEVNPGLLSVENHFDLKSGDRVLVPLCGKSLDLLWFTHQKLKVIGIELSPIACEEFFCENRIAFEKARIEKFEVYQAPQIEIWCGDFFDFEYREPFDFIYDRASNIALPPEMRKLYYPQIQRFLSSKTQLCLMTIEYPQALIEGPPFSVSESEVEKAYADFQIKKLRDKELEMENKRFEEAKVKVREKIYRISKTGGISHK